jgi:hypothetical protein
MAKTIYTERDIEDLIRRGAREIIMTDDVYLTDAAREKAEKNGVALLANAAPVLRPVAPTPIVPAHNAPPENAEQLVNQVKADVLAKLGPGVDATIIDRIVRQVVRQLQ